MPPRRRTTLARRACAALLALAAAAGPAGCNRGGAPTSAPPPPRSTPLPPRTEPGAAPAAVRDPVAPAVPELPPTSRAAPARLVAIGDIHGDLAAARAALRLAGAVDAQDHWSGGQLVVVQTGDVLDRGDQERAILDWLDRLADEAARAGGALYVLNGNHELMNVALDFRYVTRGGYEEFGSFADLAARYAPLAAMPAPMRARAAAFAPGGPYARRLAAHNTVMVVGDTLFVHGGLLAAHAQYGLASINRTVRAWMLGERDALPAMLEREDSPVWHRGFALGDDAATCAELAAALEAAHARRLVIGHTVQERGINSACGERVWRIDVGLARYYGGPTEVLEIAQGGTQVRVLRASPAGTTTP